MEECSTFAYKRLNGLTIHFDIYLPKNFDVTSDCGALPAVVYFHGGGLTVGNRSSWFPAWLRRRINEAGFPFVSADYRLLPSGNTTGHEILQDIIGLFAYLKHAELAWAPSEAQAAAGGVETKFKIDVNRIALAGSSAGGLCTYLAAMHLSPKPKAILSLYGQGGDFTIPHYLAVKKEVFFRGRELLDPLNFPDFIYPFTSSPTSTNVIADSPLSYHPKDSPTPGLPANPRMFIARLWLQLGVYLDYFTGQHEPSLSEQLRALGDKVDDNALRELTPKRHQKIIPQLNVTSSWPPTFLCHGSLDTAVPVRESEHLYRLLKEQGVDTELLIVEGKEHSFDYEPDAEMTLKKEFDAMAGFLISRLNV